MDERRTIGRALQQMEDTLKELHVRFEQYFAGVEKRAPLQDRDKLARSIRQFANRHITQTDLSFKYRNLASRFHSYNQNWERILRLMDEGKYVRQMVKGSSAPPPSRPSSKQSEDESVYQELLKAHKTSNPQGKPPGKEQVSKLLENQREKIREKFGSRPVEFHVVTENGKPKIKVRAKR